jgi:cell division protein FtsL
LRSRAPFFFLLLFVIVCIVLDALQQVWIEWKRLLWGELGMRVIEKVRLTFGRAVSR